MAENGLKMVGKEIVGGTAQPLSLVTDGDGFYVLRVVDAAPFAYDSTMESLKITNNITLLQSAVGNASLNSNANLYLIASVVNDNTGILNLDVSKYRRISALIANNHNKAITCSLAKKVTSATSANGLDIVSAVSIPAGSVLVIEPVVYTKLDIPFPYVYFKLAQTAGDPPTSGYVNAWIYGSVL